MKYIFLTFSGLSYPIAYKLQREGHEVIVGQIYDIKDYVMEEEMRHAHESEEEKKLRLEMFKGMLPMQDAHKVVEMMKTIKNPHDYFVFFEENNLYRWADKVVGLGFEGNFPTKEDYLFEIDRDHAKKFVKEHYPKLYVPEVVEFDKVPEAIKFLEKTQEIWVLKGKDDAARTFVPDVADIDLAKEQVIQVLQSFPAQYEKLGFILELFIPSMAEFTPERMYYDGVPIVTIIGLENKSFGSGNISIQTGCSQEMAFPIDMNDRIAQIAFPPIVDEMARQHKGLFIWDASLLVNRKDGKIYFGEFCSNRPGYNSFFSELAQCGPVNDFFEKIVHKQNPFTLGNITTSVRVFNMNTDKNDKVSGDIVVNFKPEIEQDLWLWDVKKNKEDKIVSVGESWNFCVITGVGKSIDEAVTKLYRNVEGLSFVGAYYRSKDDYLSLDYSSSILNRLNYGVERGLFKLPFDVYVGDIK